MDLYDFIDANARVVNRVVGIQQPEGGIIPSSGVENEGKDIGEANIETVEALRQERDNLLSEADSLRQRIGSLEEENSRLKKGASEFSQLLQTLRSGREELHSKIEALEKQVQSLEMEKVALRNQISGLEAEGARAKQEAEQVINQKETELDRLRSEIAVLQQKIGERDALLQEADQTIKDKTFEIGQLTANNAALQEVLKSEEEKVKQFGFERETMLLDIERLKRDYAAYLHKTKMAFAIISIVAIVVVASLFMYFTKRPIPEQKPMQSQLPAKESSVQQQDDDAQRAKEAVTPKTPEGGRILETTKAKETDRQDTKTAAKSKQAAATDAKPLRPISLQMAGIKVDATSIGNAEAERLASAIKYRAEADKHYYLVTLSGKAVSSGSKGSPSIDFIDAKNRLASASGFVKVLHVVADRPDKRKAATEINCLVSLSKDFQPKGLVIGHPTKRIVKMVIL